MSTSLSTREPRPLSPLRDFLKRESAGGILILMATITALVWANSGLKNSYHALWSTDLSLSLGRYSFGFDLHHWVNDGLMTLFFFVVGLEIKREATSGHLSQRKTLALPLFGAVGGMVIPAAAYLLVAGGTEPRGWGVPMATDIALAVGLLSALGSRVSPSVRAFLLGLAVVDDIGAIIVIALFYSSGVSGTWLALAVASVLLTVVMQRSRVRMIAPYVVNGVLLWFFLYQGGVHPTIAGVAMGLMTPLIPRNTADFVDIEDLERDPSAKESVSLVEWFEHLLHPWTTFLIVPVFALANAGIEISSDALRDASTSPIAWGVFVGLVVGKPLGVVLATSLSRRVGVAEAPDGATSRTFLGVGGAAGIGFTVALFISDLAFTDPSHQAEAKLAILLASVVSALFAVAVMGGAREKVTVKTSP